MAAPNVGSLLSGAGSGLSGIFPMLFTLVLVVGPIGVITYLLMLWKRYNVNVEIYSPRGGNSFKIFSDKGGFVKKKGEFQFKLLKMKTTVPFVELKHIFSQGKKNFLKLLESDKGELIPMEVTIDSRDLMLKPEDIDIKMYRDQRFQKNRLLYDKKTPLEKLVPVMVIAVPTVLMIVMLYIVLKDMNGISANLATAMSHCRAVAGAP